MTISLLNIFFSLITLSASLSVFFLKKKKKDPAPYQIHLISEDIQSLPLN